MVFIYISQMFLCSISFSVRCLFESFVQFSIRLLFFYLFVCRNLYIFCMVILCVVITSPKL